eukprot:UN28218
MGGPISSPAAAGLSPSLGPGERPGPQAEHRRLAQTCLKSQSSCVLTGSTHAGVWDRLMLTVPTQDCAVSMAVSTPALCRLQLRLVRSDLEGSSVQWWSRGRGQSAAMPPPTAGAEGCLMWTALTTVSAVFDGCVNTCYEEEEDLEHD